MRIAASCCHHAVSRAGGGARPLFQVGLIRPIFGRWRRPPTPPRSPAELRNRKRTGPTCSRSGPRSPSCSIPPSTAARAASVPQRDCSLRRTIPGTAAAAARPPRIARGRRPRAGARMSRPATRRRGPCRCGRIRSRRGSGRPSVTRHELQPSRTLRSLPPCGGGLGRGVPQAPVNPPPPPPRKGERRRAWQRDLRRLPRWLTT